jgi:hypothetical protein
MFFPIYHVKLGEARRDNSTSLMLEIQEQKKGLKVTLLIQKIVTKEENKTRNHLRKCAAEWVSFSLDEMGVD